MNRDHLVALFLIFGAALGFTLGSIVADAGMAPIYGAVGAGLGIALGAAVASTKLSERNRR